MLTKTEILILKVFVSRITKKFSIKEISEILKKQYPLIHRASSNLIEKGYIKSDERKLLSLNYKENIAELSFVEAQRTKEALNNKNSISLFIKDCLNELKEDFFIFLIFGSFVEKNKFNDLDIMIILDKPEKIERTEKMLSNIYSNFSFKTDINIISKESAYEMLSKREQINIINESLNKHLIVFGGENYYRMLANAR